MKIGDKVYCIKDVYYIKELIFNKDKEYLIFTLYDDGEIVLESNIGLFSFKYPNAIYYGDFILFSSECYLDEPISKYFRTQKEYSKLKLEKLYNVNVV